MRKLTGITVLLASILAGSINMAQLVPVQAEDKNEDAKPAKKADGKTFSGKASWYGPGFNGKKTASGEIFDMNKCSAAHLKLPFQTRVQVEDPRTGKTVIVKVNDRGPYVKTRVMDMSKGAAVKLGTISRGVAFIDCLVLDD